ADGCGLADLSRRTELKPPTARNLLATLCELGYAEQSEQTRAYRLGRRARTMGHPQAKVERLRRAGAQTIKRLSDTINETILLAVYQNGKRNTIVSIESDHELRVGAQVGEDQHFYKTATGRLLLAMLPRRECAQQIDRLGQPTADDWVQATENVDAFQRELATIARAGLSVLDKTGNHVTAVAVPVNTAPSGPIAALGLYYPSVRDNGERRQELVVLLKAAAAQVSEAYGRG
ncbi:MAG: IclR family transcriptional regulator, partial [Lentisphaeria bacterium]|nr:IclR family transcriptional regulator [Lentisphaeria bacterium]